MTPAIRIATLQRHQILSRSSTLLAAILCAVVAGCASKPPPATKVSLNTDEGLDGPQFVQGQSRTAAPFAYVMFCTRNRGECGRSGGSDTVSLTSAREAQLSAVNRQVNNSITPKNDSGDDVWTISPKAGDCEDYAVTKRHVLVQQGWPSSSLRYGIGYASDGEGHLVLVVRTTRGDLVLDNLSNRVMPWSEASMSWRMIQSAKNPSVWYKT